MRASCLSLLILALFAACQGKQTGEPPAAGPTQRPAPPALPADLPPSNRKMAERLQAVARQTSAGNPYRNDIGVDRARERLAAASTPQDRARYENDLAIQLLYAGYPRASLEAIGRVEKIMRWKMAWRRLDRTPIMRLKAIANMRLGEQENCILNHSVDSCLLPIEGEGVHTLTEGSQAAFGLYKSLLEADPDNLIARWLLNVSAMTLGDWPRNVPEQWLIPPPVFESDYAMRRFRDVAPAVGLAGPTLCGGAIIEDFNGDGLLDIMASSWGPEDQLRYFENDGEGRFTERTHQAFLSGQTGGLNMTHADYDNDGDPDVLVLRGAWLDALGRQPNSLLRNLGDGRFEDVTEASGILSLHPTQTASWGDYDNDGWLDLFIGNESRQGGSGANTSELYRNNGDGTFTNVAREVGLAHVGFVKAAVWADFDNDGLLDLYLAQMASNNVLYRNQGPRGGSGPWSFRDVTAEAGVAEPVNSFPAAVFDFDNDGWLDIFIADFFDFNGNALPAVVSDYLDIETDARGAWLYRNRGDGSFENVAERVGLDRVLLGMGLNFGDIDNDGWQDLYVGTGEPQFETLVPNRMFRNDAGRRFQDVTTAGGFGNIQKGHGIAFGDIDNDGDQDIFAEMGGAYSGDTYQNILFENPGNDHRWITLRLTGRQSNRSAVGARVRVVVASARGQREIHRVVGTGGSFGSSSLQLEIGLGAATAIEQLDVRWPASNQTQSFADVPLDRTLRVVEGQSELEPLATRSFTLARVPPRGHEHDHGQ